MTETLAPEAVWRTWFPAVVRLPDKTVILKAKVYATGAGLFVYANGNPVPVQLSPARTTAGTSPTLVFHSPILLDKTAVPGTDYASQQRGHVIVTEAGTVTITKSGACSCGMRALKTFTPAWARTERKWGE